MTTSANGFATCKSENDVVLSVGGVRDLDIALTVSSSGVTVNVESSANQVNVGDTSVQGVVDGKQTRDLPLNGRDWTSLATLNAGVSQVLTQYPGAATATTRLSRGLGAQLTIGGNRPQQNSYRLDGVNINDYANGGPGSVYSVTLGVDAVQEFTVITSDAPAQYGRMSGGVINSITRTGANPSTAPSTTSSATAPSTRAATSIRSRRRALLPPQPVRCHHRRPHRQGQDLLLLQL